MPSHEVNDEQSEPQNHQFNALVRALRFVTDEPLVLAQYEMTAMPGKFAKLWQDGDGEFDKRVNRAVEHLGAPPEAYLLREGQEAPPADNYPEAVVREAFAVFARARKSVIRAALFHTGASTLTANPDLLELDNLEARDKLINQVQAAFWEHAEAAYIRLYSFWDRVGQVMDFAFFNIRKFDQNGFTSVMDRIHANAVPMDDRLKNCGGWKRLRSFQVSEREDGLKWLLQRRNIVVHSLHLHPVPADRDSVFKSQFNHLETAHREKLRPKDPADEIELIIGQLSKAGELFRDVLAVIELSPSRKKSPWL